MFSLLRWSHTSSSPAMPFFCRLICKSQQAHLEKRLRTLIHIEEVGPDQAFPFCKLSPFGTFHKTSIGCRKEGLLARSMRLVLFE